MQGHKTVAIDFDVGLRNLDLVMGCERRVVYDFVNVIRGEAKLQQALIRDKRIENLYVLPASQTRDKDALDPEGVGRVIDELKQHGLRLHHLRLARRHREGRADGHVLRRRGDRRDQPRGLVGARLRPRARPARRQDQPRRAGRQPDQDPPAADALLADDGQAGRDAERRRRARAARHPAAGRDPGVEGGPAVVEQGHARDPGRDHRRGAGLPSTSSTASWARSASTASSRKRSAASSAACSANRERGQS